MKILYFNYKITALLSTIVATSGLTLATTANYNLPGFHITVKENNNNIINLANTWNTINDKYEQLLENSKDKLINVSFNKWYDITNQLQDPNDGISKVVASAFQAEVADTTNHFMPRDGKQFLDGAIIGRSFANKNFDSNISSFGSVYFSYNDQLPTIINNGLFAQIDPKSNFTNYFSIPYTLQAADSITSQTLSQRLKIIPIGNNTIKNESENELVILATPASANETLVINSDNVSIPTFKNGNLTYAIISHNPSDGFKPTKFSIDASSDTTKQTTHKDIIIANDTSQLSFTSGTAVNCQYLVQNINNNDNLIVMNSAKGNATVNILSNQKWTYAKVDAKSLVIDSQTTNPITNGQILTASSSPSGIQVYYLSLDKNSASSAAQQASGQYITIYNQNSEPTFNNCTNLLDDGNVTLQGFQQYLNSTTNNLQVSDLKLNPSSLVSQFIIYQGAIAKHNYVNYLTTGNDNNPFHVNVKAYSKTLVNNWNIIIFTIIFFTILITLPFVILLIRKRKHLK